LTLGDVSPQMKFNLAVCSCVTVQCRRLPGYSDLARAAREARAQLSSIAFLSGESPPALQVRCRFTCFPTSSAPAAVPSRSTYLHCLWLTGLCYAERGATTTRTTGAAVTAATATVVVLITQGAALPIGHASERDRRWVRIEVLRIARRILRSCIRCCGICDE